MARVPTHTIADGVTYQCHPDHRNCTPRKSQWTISEPEEVNCFRLTWREGWVNDKAGWGLHLVAGRPAHLGVAQDHRTPVFIAKFVASGAQSCWHGFPADHSQTYDRPSDRVLGLWLLNGTLPPAKIRKVQKGEPCSL